MDEGSSFQYEMLKVFTVCCVFRLLREFESYFSRWLFRCQHYSISGPCWLSSLLSMQLSGWLSSVMLNIKEPSMTWSTLKHLEDQCSFCSGNDQHLKTFLLHKRCIQLLVANYSENEEVLLFPQSSTALCVTLLQLFYYHLKSFSIFSQGSVFPGLDSKDTKTWHEEEFRGHQ